MHVKVGLLGNIGGSATGFYAGLRGLGVEAKLFLSCDEHAGAAAVDASTVAPGGELSGAVVYCVHGAGGCPWRRPGAPQALGPGRLLRLLFACDLVHAQTGYLHFSRWSKLLYSVLRVRPYVAGATGSDLRELAFEPSRRGFWMRAFFSRSRRVLLMNVDMLPLAARLRLRQAAFFPFAVDTEAFKPGAAQREWPGSGLKVFTSSRWDMGVSDPAPGRFSSKGNEVLLHGLAIARSEGVNAHLVAVDRGPDVTHARAMVVESGLVASVTFVPDTGRTARLEWLRAADVVADQFTVPALGLTALEALATGKTLISNLDEPAATRCYEGDPPPILRASDGRSVADALAAVRRAGDAAARGRRCREWTLRHHARVAVAGRLLKVYEGALTSG